VVQGQRGEPPGHRAASALSRQLAARPAPRTRILAGRRWLCSHRLRTRGAGVPRHTHRYPWVTVIARCDLDADAPPAPQSPTPCRTGCHRSAVRADSGGAAT
jgi:hypothetical protein